MLFQFSSYEPNINFWTGQGANGSGNGQVIAGAYNNWGGTSTGIVKEPDDFMSNQDAGAIALSGWPAGTTMLGIEGEWNDINITNQLYYIIEYGSSTKIEESKPSGIRIYPNPSNGVFTIQNLPSSQNMLGLEITDITGKIILTMEHAPLQNISSLQIDFSTMGYAPLQGIYFLKIHSENKCSITKIIIK